MQICDERRAGNQITYVLWLLRRQKFAAHGLAAELTIVGLFADVALAFRTPFVFLIGESKHANFPHS